MEQVITKMPLSFLAAAKDEMNNKYAKTCAVSATGQYTAFMHEGKIFVGVGNLHDKVDAPFCIEFDLRYNHGNVTINSQRIYQND